MNILKILSLSLSPIVYLEIVKHFSVYKMVFGLSIIIQISCSHEQPNVAKNHMTNPI